MQIEVGSKEYLMFCDVFGDEYVHKYLKNGEIKDFDKFLLDSPFSYFITDNFFSTFKDPWFGKNVIELNMKESYEMFGIEFLWDVRERAYQEIEPHYYNDYKLKLRKNKIERIIK